MIGQHFLQQQRLHYNHDRLLERYQRLLSPQISEFRPFGCSSLPGRNYERYLNSANGTQNQRDSLVALSRAGIGSSSETYRFIGQRSSETLPRNVSSVMKHTREQSIPFVHAEKFEPVQVYEHPVFGLTPAYIRPLDSKRSNLEDINDEDSSDDDETDNEVRSHVTSGTSLKPDHHEETKKSSTTVKDNDNDDEDLSKYIPKGYISYKQWKEKYENLIPVNPLLYSIYTRRTNGSINSYGQSLYASLNHTRPHRPSNRDEDVLTPTLSDIDSVSSELPHETSSSSSQQYQRLQQQLLPVTVRTRPLEPIRTGNNSDEPGSPESPVPYLSRNKPSFITPIPVSKTMPLTSTTSLSSVPTIGLTSTPSISTSEIKSTLDSSIDKTTDILPSSSATMNTSNIPLAPPIPPSLLATTPTPSYQTPSNLPIAPPLPKAFSSSSSTATYQTPSNAYTPMPSVSSSMPMSNSTKAVTFGGSSSTLIGQNDVSSSSDSDDDDAEKKKRRRRKKKEALANTGVAVDSSSSDD
ncbi:unnamed protein product [Rotaria magnacalcarata]|uniref:Uncharacterized protein n=2 Tax=Rotaria magnacalcarata TaxID=392030 RepID=A0A819ML65_9BILA|nr:unnamed protein product [Rotaria magnacalcarata]CAF2043761.1 unnamed protein product [Rotaria magnacalcarata]CAF2076836.1 unnamed protein product [Rotaria magnacalcarata]CAF3981464.1 unnamed protein product [Rotaria magnacalcarata]CAF4069779.1 unnamed protein product [Rotaria magnacalcarata]